MSRTVCVLLLLAMVLAGPALAASDDSFLIRGATIHPVSSDAIANGAVRVRDGKIVAVGVRVPAASGVRVIDAKGLHLYPGLIDSGTELGLTEVEGIRETNDYAEIGAIHPQLEALTAVNPASEHIPVNRANGITAAVTLPTGGVLCGQAGIIHLDGWTVAEMEMRRSAGMQLNFPVIESGRRQVLERFVTTPYAEAKRRYDEQLRDLEAFFEAARRYSTAKAAGSTAVDRRYEALLPVLEGRLPLVVSASQERTIRAAIAFADRQKVRVILQHGNEAYRVAEDLKKRGIPVVLGPTLALPEHEDDPYDKPFSAPGELVRAGVKIAFATFGPTASQNPRNLPYQAATAVAFGLPYDEALKAITLGAAQIWGIEREIGSIEAGKLADLILTDGDPLEAKTQVRQMWIRGKAVDLENKHRRLYEKYLNRP